MVHLQRLHEEYKRKDVVILGFNCADAREFALGFLKEKGVTFPNVVDSSPEARDVYGRGYRGSAVPLNFILDRKGRVVAAFAGYSADDPQGPDAIQAALAAPAPKEPEGETPR